MTSTSSIIYRPSKTLKQLHLDSSFVRGIIGPIGSGKSVGCLAELLMRSYKQQPNENNVRQTRWVIIRNTYRELLDTTMETFFEWIPESSGKMHKMNMKFVLSQKLDDGTTLQAEFLFRALDRPRDVKKLLSLDLTGGFVNEAREVPLQVIEMLQGRCGRFPKTHKDPVTKETLYGPTWHGIIMDTNPPDSDSWWYKLFEERKPDNHKLFHQPSGVSPEAENIDNLPDKYYINMQAGKDKEWINVYVHGIYGFIADGKPVFPEYKDDIHSTLEDYVPNPKATLYIGIDFGLTPAAVFGQITSSGQMCIFDELCTFDMGAMNFGRLLREKISSQYAIFKDIEIYGDPSGEQRAQTDEVTPFLILQNQGIMAIPAYTNDFTIRREAVADYMQRLDFNGQPAFKVYSTANVLRKGLAGGYKYKRMQVSGEEKFMDKPDKNSRYSHVCDALQYLFLGAVGGSRVIGGWDNSKPLPQDYTGIV